MEPWMIRRLLPQAVLLLTFVAGTAAGQSLEPPRAEKKPHSVEAHGLSRNDEYFWLNQRENPEVISYLNRENEYTKAVMAEHETLVKNLFDEIVSRIKQDDSSVPYELDGFIYYTRFNQGQQYPIYCRKKGTEEAPEEIILDVNSLAEGKPFCSVAGVEPSRNGKLLAFGVDFVGRRQYSLVFKNLETGEMLPDSIANVSGSAVWAADNQTVFYTLNDPETLRSYLVRRHVLGTDPANDPDVFEEKDTEFACGVGESRSRDYIVIGSRQTLSAEFRVLPSDTPEGEFRVFRAREPDHEYSMDHLNGEFVVVSNLEATNFRVFRVGEDEAQWQDWQEFIPHREDVLVEGVDLFDNWYVVTERSNALTRLRVIARDGSEDFTMPFEESAYVVSSSPVPNPSTNWLRFRYTSLTTPGQTSEFNMATRETRILKEEPVLGDFDRKNYRTERLWATARDGTRIPVTAVWHKDTPIDGTAPCLQYGYGSYGSSMDPAFQVALLPLLDRGFVFAIAHIRGGQELGRQWYDDGKLLNKKNTFTDFIDVGKFLIEKGYSDKNRLYARGGSAGGLLMGAVINMAPELYHGVIADVPFVDVVTTMLDDSIPLTTFEYDEWGNPGDREYYDYMLSYSPYDNVSKKPYPNLLVTTGLHDSQVQYFEPAKWVARLRDNWDGDRLLLLKTNMESGHGGASGRFDRHKETAFRYAFLLRLAGIAE
jgi:oligopeptidase B